MAYEYEDKINDAFFIASRDGRNVNKELLKELQEVYSKAKAFDEIEQSYWKSNTPENFAYEFVRIFENRFSGDKEGSDDERS